jgi:hypothetical protein
MATTITLPIKCSTVKKVDDALWYILHALFGAYAGLFIPAAIYITTVYGYDADFMDIGFINTATLVLSVLSCMLLCFAIAINIDDIIQMLPSLACIKDDEVQP